MKIKIELDMAFAQELTARIGKWLNAMYARQKEGCSTHKEDLQYFVLSQIYKRLTRLTWEGKTKHLTFQQVEIDTIYSTIGLLESQASMQLEKYDSNDFRLKPFHPMG